MAPEQHHGDNLQILAESAPLPSSHIANGFGASCAKNAMMFDLPKVCCCQSVMDDGLLPRRKSASRPRLPCFKGLGISTIDQASAEDGQTQAAGYPGLQGRSFEQSSAGRAASGSTPLLTPPEELDSLKWPSSTRASSVLAKSRSHTNIEPSIGRAASKVEIASLSERGPPSEGISLATSGSGGSNSHQGAAVVDTTPSSPESGESTSCLDQSVAAAGECASRDLEIGLEGCLRKLLQ